MFLDNNEKEKEKWLKNERHMRLIIIGIIIAILLLIIVVIFFRTQIWAIITGLAVLVGLVVDLITLIRMKKGE